MAKKGKVGKMTETATGDQKEFADSGMEGNKSPEEPATEAAAGEKLDQEGAADETVAGDPAGETAGAGEAGADGTPAASDGEPEKTFVTCEDVLKDLRAKGHRI